MFKNCFAVFFRKGQSYEFCNKLGMIKGLKYSNSDLKNQVIEIEMTEELDSSSARSQVVPLQL